MTTHGRTDVLLVGQTPPPFHGQAMVTSILFNHDWGALSVERLRMSYSPTIDSVGSFSLRKVFHLASLVLKTWSLLLRKRPRILYYLPASPATVPVARDILYLGLVRWFFPRIVFHYHAGGLADFIANHPWLRRIAQRVYGKADLSIEVNEWLPPSGLYFRARRNIAIANGVKVERLPRIRPESARFRLLYVGMLCDEKGIPEMVETLAELRSRNIDAEILFVGDWISEPFRIRMLDAVERAGLGDRVIWAGVLQGNAKWQAYADADCFLFPSHHPTETFGLVLVEAMAFALPLITTRWRGIPTVVGEVGCAILCDIHRPAQYADAAARISGDPALRERMGAAARSRYEQHFTQERFLNRMSAEFATLLQP